MTVKWKYGLDMICIYKERGICLRHVKLPHKQTGHPEDGWSCGSCCHCKGSIHFLSFSPFHSLLPFCHLCFSLPHCLTVHWEIHTCAQKSHKTRTDALSLFLVCIKSCANTKGKHTQHTNCRTQTVAHLLSGSFLWVMVSWQKTKQSSDYIK